MDIISNIPATLEWHVYKGDTTVMTIIVEDNDGTEIDVSGYTLIGQIKTGPTDSVALQELDLSVEGNVITAEITASDELPRMSYFDIQATKEDLTVSTLIKGYIYSEDDVSR